MTNSYRITVFVVLFLVLVGCVADSEFIERRNYWKSEVETFFESPRTVSELSTWLDERGIKYQHKHSISDAGHDFPHALDLAMTTNQTFWCSWQTVSLRFYELEDEIIGRYEFYGAGDCWW